YYVGSAPKRFIVEAKLVSNDPETKFASDTLNGALPEADDQHKTHTQRKLSDVRAPHTASHLVKPQAHRNGDQHAAKDETAKKRGFWHKLFHL
ncbi:MAG: hypothetical protein JO211_12370, partial [Acidobacteriaceae bacterium]|nr:hypothetical protein [Acidobacteriaceae bacterium]